MLPIPAFTTRTRLPVLLLALLLAVGLGWAIAQGGMAVPGLLIAAAIGVPLFIGIAKEPRIGVITLIAYCFLLFFISRLVDPSIPFGLGVDALLVLTWVLIIFQYQRFDWHYLRSDLAVLALLWFAVNVLEIVNPGASIQGWYQEMRSTTLYWVLLVPLALLVFNQRRDLDLFLILIIGLSVLGALNGLKQLFIGLSAGEQAFLNENIKTHLLWGKLRVFSFYSDAGQFGAAQAHLVLIAGILALGPFKPWKRLLLAAATGLLLIGMFISGTRGALFALGTGIAVALLISKNFKAFALGSVLAIAAFGVLKYTHIGDTNYNIYRMRTALDPNDASLNVRLTNQLRLADYLSSRPFGGGVGTIGNAGIHYNPGTVLASIPPDSYWVKVWAMYGVVGLTIWLGIMLYTLGKCGGIIWRIRDPGLRTKLIALTAGFAGSLFSSYGNEVINFMPSALIVYLSWVFIFLGPRLDKSLAASA
ncbi:MAG: O-antigen ligase domain-containing protein [Hymenobacter sp.]|nr:MAG: O-antigen ligase domain-containing protein [Hymenobacter sp.]